MLLSALGAVLIFAVLLLGLGLVRRIVGWISLALGREDMPLERSSLPLLAVVGGLAVAYELYAVHVARRAIRGDGLQEDGATFTIPKQPVRRRIHGIQTFNVLRGDEYLFMPSMSALRWIADLGQPGGAGQPST